MAQADPANGVKAIIEDGHIVIRIDVTALPMIVEGAWASPDGSLWATRYQVTNADEFARDLVVELNRENELGTTRIHKMFDGAILEAIEQGALGIEEHPEQSA